MPQNVRVWSLWCSWPETAPECLTDPPLSNNRCELAQTTVVEASYSHRRFRFQRASDWKCFCRKRTKGTSFEMTDKCSCCSRKVHDRTDRGGNETRKVGRRVSFKAPVRGPRGGDAVRQAERIFISLQRSCAHQADSAALFSFSFLNPASPFWRFAFRLPSAGLSAAQKEGLMEAPPPGGVSERCISTELHIHPGVAAAGRPGSSAVSGDLANE